MMRRLSSHRSNSVVWEPQKFSIIQKITRLYGSLIEIFFYGYINFRLEISPRARTERKCQDYSIRFMIFSQKNCYFNLQTYLLNLHVNMYFN